MELTVKMQYELLELAMSTDEKVRNSYEKLIPYVKSTVHEYLINLIFDGNKKAYNAINKAYRAGGVDREKITEVPLNKYKLFNRSAMGLSRAIKRVKESTDSTLLDYEESLFLAGLDSEKIKAMVAVMPEGLTESEVSAVVKQVKATTTPTSTPAAVQTATQTAVASTNTVSKPTKPRKVNPPTQEKLVKTLESVEVSVGLKALIEVAKKKGKLGLARHLEALLGEAMVTLDVADLVDANDDWDDF